MYGKSIHSGNLTIKSDFVEFGLWYFSVWHFEHYVGPTFYHIQVTVREVDEGYIYGPFTCHAKNQYGDGFLDVEMRRACKFSHLVQSSLFAAAATFVVVTKCFGGRGEEGYYHKITLIINFNITRR